jgi:hypothetical protein
VKKLGLVAIIESSRFQSGVNGLIPQPVRNKILVNESFLTCSAWITTDGLFCNNMPSSMVENKPVEEKSLSMSENNDVETLSKDCRFKVFPNPNNGSFTNELTGFTDQNSVAVFDLMGKMVYQAENLGQNTTIELTTLPKGIYFAKATGFTDN